MNKRLPLLELCNVSYGLDDRQILNHVDWTVHPGEHWVILGENGSGKSTLLKIACGFIWPNRGGTVRRNGSERLDLRELRKSIGWVTASLVPQIPSREPMLRTVVSGKFAQIGLLELSSINPTREDFQNAEALLGRMGCAHLAAQAFGTLSQGEQQKALIARALMTQPYLMFLDEPCAGLDPGARENLLETLAQLTTHAELPSMVYVTHHIEEILPSFEKTLILEKGRVYRKGNTAEVLTAELLRDLYGIRFNLVATGGRFWAMPDE